MADIKEIVRSVPVFGPLLAAARRKLFAPTEFRHSGQYWDDRYAAGGNSGSGSYKRLAEFKAEVINRFVHTHKITSVVELGCGDGAQLQLAHYPIYTGYDISPRSIAMCKNKFSKDKKKQFHVIDASTTPALSDLALSLDVIYHLVEDDVYELYMKQLFSSAKRFVIIYSSDYDQVESAHVRHRKFSDWVARNRPEFTLIQSIPNRYPYDPMSPSKTSLADFYIFGTPPARS